MSSHEFFTNRDWDFTSLDDGWVEPLEIDPCDDDVCPRHPECIGCDECEE